ncbi:RluA family pseudouridine synthase [Galbibacter sp. BG1]|uniref:RluA family pseudouridine synthase n=1 Tax=Galbibacter sp. BG1 TaxID=1170699 RepID=UPI0015B7E1C9|nr:RluA family pseudouridine synthase [Galbibacter sp. BG1]QLE03088.1 RluA family pseudouridine synthase [Galbibacter sp. BG1]
MNIKETHIATFQNKPIRLQEYGVGIFETTPTKSALKKALKKQLIKVNGKLATTATYISGGEEIVLHVPEVVQPSKKLIFPLEVLYEDDYLSVVYKPAGIAVSGNRFKTIANALSQNLKLSTERDATRPQPVHRLDYPTTGVLLVGKTNGCIRALNELFELKKIKKTYYAVTTGKMKPVGDIRFSIDGKESYSQYEVVQTVPSDRFGTLNLVKLIPKTGRKHQLRKHLSSIGNPILGDQQYGIEDLILKGKGLYLHACSLKFEHPFTGKEICLSSDLPKKFTRIFDLEK